MNERDTVPDQWGDAIARFLADLLDDVEVSVFTDAPEGAACEGARLPQNPQPGPDGRRRQFSVRAMHGIDGLVGQGLPPELSDLPEAALRGLARATSASSLRYPSIGRALHDVIIAEVIADRLARRVGDAVPLDTLVMTVADTLEYLAELSVMRVEGVPVTHGIVIAGDTLGVEPVVESLAYPGRLATRKRTPLLFDGTQSTLVVNASGHVVRSVERASLPSAGPDVAGLPVYDELPGIDGSLTAAASAAFRGIGFYLGARHSTWVFDEGALLFVRRGMRWKSIAFESFTRVVTELGMTSATVGRRVARAALRLSVQGQGAILAVAGDRARLDTVTQPKDRVPAADGRGDVGGHGDIDEDLRQLLRLHDISSPGGLARLARLDGATIIDPDGAVMAYGAVVRTADSPGEGARSAAARALSSVSNVALSVSHDGPITVYHQGSVVLELL